MYLLGMFVSQQFQEAGQADLDDLDFFPYTDFGTEFDAEKALEPRSTGAPSARQADESRRRQGVQTSTSPSRPAQGDLGNRRPGNIAAAKDADTNGCSPLRRRPPRSSHAQRITQFLDRDTNPNFAGPNGMQQFLLEFLQDPNQDVAALQKKIQDFWDTL